MKKQNKDQQIAILESELDELESLMRTSVKELRIDVETWKDLPKACAARMTELETATRRSRSVPAMVRNR